MLDALVSLRLGAFALEAEMVVSDGQTVALLGPNGAGKTTLLRALAGFHRLDAGRIVLDGTTVDDPSAGHYVAPERRHTGVVFQDYLLFPHLDARDNVAFGLRARGVPRRDARRIAANWLTTMGLADQLRAKSRQLSGGQAQRVSLARALAPEPSVLLLDEPLAALDAGARTEVRRDLRARLASFPGTTVLVTHDLLDVVALADRLVVLEHGTVTQEGTQAEVCAQPRSRYVAELVGLNLLRGHARGRAVRLDDGGELVVAEAMDGDLYVAIHPHAVALHRRHPEGSSRNVWRGHVHGIDLLADRVRVHVDGQVPLVAEVTPGSIEALALRDGVEVWASVKATEVSAYPI